MTSPNEPNSAGPVVHETSSERWAKYGANVLLSCVIVVVLAAIVIWGAQRYDKRADMTVSSSYSLKPQTVNVINDLKEPIKLVGLYARLKQDQVGQQQDFYTAIADLLEEYRRKGKNIEVELIDPVGEPAKLDRWLAEVRDKYGGNVKSYRDLLNEFPQTLDQIKTIAADESKRMEGTLRSVKFENEEQADTINVAYNTIKAWPTVMLQPISAAIKEELEKKIPDYKGQVGNVRSSLATFSRQVEGVTKALEQLRDEKTAPQPARDYAKDSIPQFEKMKKLADDEVNKAKALGELKLDEVRRKLTADEEGSYTSTRTIAVEGKNDIKLIDFKDVWKSGESTGLSGRGGGPPRLRFAGEQQITASILSLEAAKKPKVAFVRGGGPPRTNPMFLQAWQSGLTEIADRLRAYNFDVLEKDVSGQFAQMAAMRQMPFAEPSDEDIKDAIWVVLPEEPQMSQFGPAPPSPVLGQKVAAHMNEGGSALCLFEAQSGDLSSVLKDWGVAVKTSIVAVHEPVISSAEPSGDFIEQARREPYIFVINEYGDHPITSTLRSLDAALVPMLVVDAPGAPDCTVTKILPVPQDLKSWGESDFTSVGARKTPTFDPASGDLPPPLWSGAAVEKKDKGRLVVIGSGSFIANGLLSFNDPKLERSKVEVARFPGNGELFTNSIFWLAHMDKMIALSPAAMDTARIKPISKGALAFWRIGVLLIGLPLCAVAAGLVVYQVRKD